MGLPRITIARVLKVGFVVSLLALLFYFNFAAMLGIKKEYALLIVPGWLIVTGVCYRLGLLDGPSVEGQNVPHHAHVSTRELFERQDAGLK